MTVKKYEDVPKYAKVCMEYLHSLYDIPSVSRRGVIQILAYVSTENTVNSVQRGLGRSDSDFLRNTTTQHGIRGLASSSQPGTTTTHNFPRQVIAAPDFVYDGNVSSPTRRNKGQSL